LYYFFWESGLKTFETHQPFSPNEMMPMFFSILLEKAKGARKRDATPKALVCFDRSIFILQPRSQGPACPDRFRNHKSGKANTANETPQYLPHVERHLNDVG